MLDDPEPCLAKQEGVEQVGAGPMYGAKRKRLRIAKKSEGFQSLVALWGEQCMAFQASGKTWLPTKPCCPANPFLGLEATLWQGCAKDRATACVQLLNKNELSELRDFYWQNRHHDLFNSRDSTVGSLPQLCEPNRAGPTAEGEQVVTRRFRGLERQSGIQGICWHSAKLHWQLSFYEAGKRKRFNFPISKHMKLGLSEAEAVETALEEAKAFREELVRQGKLKPPKPITEKASGSTVRGIKYNKKNGTFRVQITDPSTKKTVHGGWFKVKEEAEARARDLAKELGLQEELVPVKPLSELPHFEPLGPQPGIKWNRGELAWHAKCNVASRCKNMRFRPKDFSPKEVDNAWKQAVAWRKQQEKEKEQAEQSQKRKL